MNNDELLSASCTINKNYLPLFTSASNTTWNTAFPENFVYRGKTIYGIAKNSFNKILTNANKKYKVVFDATLAGDKAFYYAFYNCTNLTSISFPNLVSVGSYAFSDAFYNCTNLTSVSFPKLISVENSAFSCAFSNCTNLTSVSFPELTAITKNAFDLIGHSNLTIHVPSSLSSAGLDTRGTNFGTIVYDL